MSCAKSDGTSTDVDGDGLVDPDGEGLAEPGGGLPVAPALSRRSRARRAWRCTDKAGDRRRIRALEADVVAEGDQHLLQQRITALAARGLHVDRFDVQQAAGDGQRQQVAVRHAGRTALYSQDVQGRLHVRIGLELVLHLTRVR